MKSCSSRFLVLVLFTCFFRVYRWTKNSVNSLGSEVNSSNLIQNNTDQPINQPMGIHRLNLESTSFPRR